jgi:DNA-directed RNA polymerase specialized sigma subunit
MQVYKEYQEEFNVDPTIQELSELLGIQENHIREALASIKSKNTLSIDTPSHDDSTRTLGEMIPDNSTSVEELIDSKIIRRHIIQSFKKLSKREEMVIRMRFGINEVLEDDKNVYEIKSEKE